MKKNILITLAAGRTGFATSEQLLSEGYAVRIYVRSLNAKVLELQDKGAEVVLGGFGDYEALANALRGIQSVYYCYPYKPGMPADMKVFIQAAKHAGVESVIFMGQRIAEFGDTGSRLTNDVRECYELLQQSGLHVVYFAPGYFADNVFVTSEMVLQLGIFPNMFGEGKNPWISIDDMSRCIAALLKNPEPYYGKRLFPTGPASISSKEMVQIFSKVKGKKVSMFNIPDWLFLRAGIMIGKEYGFDKFAIIQGKFYNKQMRQNHFDIEPTNVVKELTGKDPEDFETITRQYFKTSKYADRKVSSWLKAFVRFNKMPFTKVPGKNAIAQINS